MNNPFDDVEQDKKKVEPEKPRELPSEEEEKRTELQMLKGQAKLIGLDVPNNVSSDTLKARIKAKLESNSKPPAEEAPKAVAKAALPKGENSEEEPRRETDQEMRLRLFKEARILVRCRITCMDPKKADLKGEILTVGNRIIGKVSRFVPYGEHCGEDGTHVEEALLQMMEERKYSQVKKDSKNRPYAVNVSEYAIQRLPPLTEKQLQQLSNKQAAARGGE